MTNLRLLTATAMMAALAGCTGLQQAATELTTLCNAATMLAPFAGPVAPWIVGGCGTVEAIDHLAADPSSTMWVADLIAKVVHPAG